MKPLFLCGRLGCKAWVLVACLWLLISCGGSQVAGGVGSGGSGVAEGSVTGFGSVIVDGVVYSDDSALVERWGESGAAEARLGQRVRVQHDGQGQAQRIVVLPQLIGPASRAPDGRGEFWLLGQRVRIVSADNTDYPATVFDGLTEVKAGDSLEVHGSWSRDSQGHDLLIASRIEKLATAPDVVLLTAMVFSRQGQQLVLDDAARTPVTASTVPDAVQSGTMVSLWLASSTVQTAATAASPWQATRVEPVSPEAATGNRLDLQAVVGETDLQQGRVRVQGMWVKLPDDPAQSTPASGTPVRMTLTRNGSDWQVSSWTARRADAQASVDIKGSLRWRGDSSKLVLRGTEVQLTSDLLSGSCADLREGEEVYIVLKAQRRDPGQTPQASAMTCSRQIPQASVQEADGTLLAVDADRKLLTVRVGDASLTLSWEDAKTLMPPSSQLRSGMAVDIEYLRGSTGLMLRKLKTQ